MPTALVLVTPDMKFRVLRKKKTDEPKPSGKCDETCACNCHVKCPHPGCGNYCMGGHAYAPVSHWCPESHWWKTGDTSVSHGTMSR